MTEKTDRERSPSQREGQSAIRNPQSAIQTVVFDLGGVLIDWNPRYLYRKLGAEEEEIEWFLGNVCTQEWNHLQDAGRTWREAVAERVARFPEHQEWIRLYHERWQDMLGGALEGTVSILEELDRRDVPLYALTNWSAETFPVAVELYPFLSTFDGIVVSGDLGVAKPEPAIFHHLVERFGLEPSTTIFIDDVEKNVAAAADLGFHAIHFQGAAALREELEARGLL